MVNPAAAQRAKLGWEAQKTYSELVGLLKQVDPTGALYQPTGVFRVAVDENLAHYFRKAWKSNVWPDNWCSWITREQLMAQVPELPHNYGGLDLHVGFWVDINSFLQKLHSRLRSKGVSVISADQYDFHESDGDIFVTSPDFANIRCGKLVFSTGAALRNHPLWSLLPMHGVKGQNAVYRLDQKITWNKPVSAYGYAIPLDETTMCIGATYEHEFENAEPDQIGVDDMNAKFRSLLPGLYEGATLQYQYSGVRLSTPNRLPMAGPHPHHENIYIFGGLGSKGVLLAPYSANLMSRHLIDKQPLPEEIDAERHWRKLRRQGKI